MRRHRKCRLEQNPGIVLGLIAGISLCFGSEGASQDAPLVAGAAKVDITRPGAESKDSVTLSPFSL